MNWINIQVEFAVPLFLATYLSLIICLEISRKLYQTIKTYWVKTVNLSSVFSSIFTIFAEKQEDFFCYKFDIGRDEFFLLSELYMDKCLASNVKFGSFWKEMFPFPLNILCLIKDPCELWTLNTNLYFISW